MEELEEGAVVLVTMEREEKPYLYKRFVSIIISTVGFLLRNRCRISIFSADNLSKGSEFV